MFLLLLGLLMHLGNCSAEQQSANQTALRFMAAAHAADANALDGMESAPLRDQLRGSEVVRLWASLQERLGAYGSCNPKRHTERPPYDIVVLACHFEKSIIEVHLSVEKGLVASFFLGQQTPSEIEPSAPDLREREVQFGRAGWQLPGTLTMPSEKPYFAASVLVHGSGSLDRDATVGRTQLFKDLAGQLARVGVATLRYEKRTYHYAVRLAQQADVSLEEETIEDAVFALKEASRQASAAGKCLFVIGHSLGAYLAPRIAADHKKLSGLVLLAAPGRPMADVVLDQIDYLLSDPTSSETTGDLLRSERKKLLDFKQNGMATKELPKLWGRSAWSFFQHYDPLSEWSSHPLKTLTVFAEKDYQVTSKDMQAWGNLARTNSLLSVSSMPGVGHVFTPVAGRPSPQSYLVKQAPSDELAKAIAAFMNEACASQH